MSGVEISTSVHNNAADLIEDLKIRRAELARASDGLIAAIGHLIQLSTSTNVCALQMHVGGVDDMSLVYDNLAYFLPVLTLITINAPYAGGVYAGQSFRIAHGYAIGKIKPDPRDRFQDLIIAKRLGTIELRVPDPVWDIERVMALTRAVEAIAALKDRRPFNRSWYNGIRNRVAVKGYIEELKPLYRELSQLTDLPESLLKKTASDEVRDLIEAHGYQKTYTALDNGYRRGVFEPGPVAGVKYTAIKLMAGLAGYYVPKLPYMVWKYLRER